VFSSYAAVSYNYNELFITIYEDQHSTYKNIENSHYDVATKYGRVILTALLFVDVHRQHHCERLVVTVCSSPTLSNRHGE